MPQKTQTYKLDYFKQGSYYSALSDLRRFVTMDYNLDSYVGIIGIGIISGWTIEVISGLTIQVLPGTGLISGFFSESPYAVKQRSDMVAGDREIEVLNENNIPEDPLTPVQRAQYVAVIQLYNPSFNPVGDIENSYVKVVTPSSTSIILANNTDTYIYAQRPTGATPYPLLADYPPPAGIPPNRSDYDTYDEYKVQLDIYDAKLAAIHNYEWYTNPANHFTEVEFVTSANFIKSPTKVLLGRVVTRNSVVSKIDVSGVDNLASLESQISRFAIEFLVEHKHGGNKPFDPPKVRLETDIRDMALWNYNESNGRTVYSVLSREFTSITLGHKHTYIMDGDGNGQTLDQIGSINSHFHKITEFVVGNPEYTIETVETHIHTVTQSTSADTWTSSSHFTVYVNGKVFGDETTPYIHADSTNKQIAFDKGVSVSNSKYSTSFSVTLKNPDTGISEVTNYSYSSRNASVFNFMLKMMQNYNETFVKYYTETLQLAVGNETPVSNIGFISYNLQNNPFLCFNSDGSIAGLQDLENQSSAAQLMLQNAGDLFTFTPSAAKNITIVLEEVGYIDSVKVEILGNTEVTGTLRSENILYLNANKILTGEFIPSVIPFVSHIGRIKEECFPLQYVLTSNDGIRYTVVPTITDVSLDHYHKLLVDKETNGVTTDVLIDNDAVYYQSDNNNNTYFIYHAHGVPDGSVASAENTGLLNWQNNVYSANLTSSIHTHNIIYPVIGNNKTIYSIKEDVNGNIYVGTSDGFMIIPQESSYQFIINGDEYYFYGGDLWDLLIKAAGQYENDTKIPMIVTESLYRSQVNSAISLLVNDGDSVLLTGTAYPDRATDYIMIKKISSFCMPNFMYTEIKDPYEVLETETVIETVQSNVNGEMVTQVVVERNFNNTPIWSLELNTVMSSSQNYISSSVSTDVIVTGSNIVAKSVGINKTPYQPWTSISLPFSTNVARKIIKDAEGNYWVSTNNGVLVSRNYSSGDIFEFTSLPGGNPDIQDILVGERGAIYCASYYGVFKTVDGGKVWSKLLDVINGFSQIARDRTLDKSTIVNGHYHLLDVDNSGNGFLEESIGSGVKHVHVVTNWDIAVTLGHTHTIIVTLYAVDNDKIIWKSVNNGSIWTQYGNLPEGECGELFAAFGFLFVSQKGGLYKSINGSTWSSVLLNKAYSYEWSYDMSELFIGSDNILYGTFDGVSFHTVYAFSGKPCSILLQSGSQKYYGYAYSNDSQSFHFKNMVFGAEELTALVDFEKWYAQGGGWNSIDLYDIYINYKRVLSTKFNEDKQDVFGYHFSVIPSTGSLDFSATTQLASPISIYDSSIDVSDSSDFSVGDFIVIMSNSDKLYATITAISGNEFTLNSRSSKVMQLPSSVKKIPYLDGQSSVLINIYNSLLSNIGELTHDQVEDGLSNYSDGRPYKFNDTYLSNLLQLTQAIRYVYPGINSEFVNDMFYDFRYSWSPADPLYPSIYNYIDVVTSETYNQKIYDNSFIGKWAKSVNKILIGFGPFSGVILVATDAGIFMSEITASFEANWFYISDLPYATYDLMIFRTTRLYAATANGTYYTSDLKTWTRETALPILYPSYSLGLRWSDQASVIAPAHTAQFIPNSITNIGTIISLSGNLYKDMSINQGIKVDGATPGTETKNGNYIIVGVSDGGSGYGSQLLVSPSFSGSASTETGVVIIMGTWWGQWNGDINTTNANITNTLLVGGEDHISYNDGGTANSWRESSFGNASSFISRKFLSLSNGRLFLAATGTTTTNQKNYLLKSDDIGQTWDIFKHFDEVAGKINSASVSDFNNTVLDVTYTLPQNYIYMSGGMDQQDIAVFSPASNVALFRGKVVWNEKNDNTDTITVYGNSLMSVVGDHADYIFSIYPTKINTMTESLQETLFFGTNKGLYYDVNTIVNNNYPNGTIVNAGINGAVQKIDISGVIISISTNTETNNTTLSVTTDTVVRGRDLIGKNLYITDTNPVEKYAIVSNASLAPGEEFVIEINIASILSSAYIGKRFMILGSSSRVYINFDLPVFDNQLNNGTLYISSNEYQNIGKTYKIISNSTNYVDLGEALTPETTMVIEQTSTTTSTTTIASNPLQVGQSVRVVDSSGLLTLWVTIDRDVKENSLKDLILTPNGNALQRHVPSEAIYSNTINSITLDTESILSYLAGDSFVIKGSLFEQLDGFSHLKTSTDSGHYHSVETVNAIVSGEILSFGTTNASYADINITNTHNFNIPIVQYSGDLFTDAKIMFTTPENVNIQYVSEVVSYTVSSIRVRIKSSSYWDFLSPNSLKISSGWYWQIDGTNYGYTVGITYDDFVVLTAGITTTANRGSNQLKLESTAGINDGDKVRIQDDTLSYEITTISLVIPPTTLQLSDSLGRTYFLKNNPQVKVLRDSFTNTHIQQIRNNEVQPLLISDYLDRGYPSEHSHRVLPLIYDVSELLNQNNNITAMGSSNIIYRSSDNGLTWNEVVDLNDFLEGSSEVDGISSAILNNNKLIVGATSGSLFVQTDTKDTIIDLNSPL